ncbi:serine protease 1 [Gilbertella persicaria]|uniref:Serine protease n=1 Tax=Rhizopus stolonifer TaxID=4846 RepID=A0A367KQ92_RHIST|nr:serine protease 1 [Gilbertella persicaria]KAI8074336.1 serine protease 1 [Gilbertella persicaria]RCI04032.1 serine protease [Rhizopus stolonifer]
MKLSLIASALLVASVANAKPLSYQDPNNNLAPLYISPETETIANSYIVVLKDSLQSHEIKEHAAWINTLTESSRAKMQAYDFLDPHATVAGIKHVYDTPNLKGYAGKFDEQVLEAIRQSDDVAFVEHDSVVYANELQRNAPWGLARISHRNPLTFKNYQQYEFNPEGGKGVKVYVIDTGINVDHIDFENRAAWGHTVPSNDVDEDGNGHGSHCAGTIAGKRYGVAKKAQPVAVKVLRSSGSGTMSDVVRGVDWATTEHLKEAAAAKKNNTKYKGAVANMSLGGGKSPSLDLAVNGAVDSGVVFAVAAGNDNRDACNYSPAAAEKAITVGASTLADERAYFSNYGECVDVFAPGLNILSVWKGSRYATNTISGTSMASPHIAGLAAYLLSLEEGEVTPKEIKDKILRLATKGALESLPKDTPNLLAYNGISEKDFKEVLSDAVDSVDGVLKEFFGDI